MLSTNDKAVVSDSPIEESKKKISFSLWRSLFNVKLQQDTQSKLARFDSDKLQETEDGWMLTFDWEALQPQRTRLIKPILYYLTEESAKLLIEAKIFADSFPEPIVLQAKLEVRINEKSSKLSELLPNWEELLNDYDEETEKN